MSPDAHAQVAEAAAAVRGRVVAAPVVGVVLGSGLGAFADALESRQGVPYAEIPHFPRPSVPGHAGTLYVGLVGGAPLACLSGRVHAYEGYATEDVVFGVRLLAALGCQAVLLTNAAGGIRSDLEPGDLMLIADHLNLTGRNPLCGAAGDFGPRFVDMTEAYDPAISGLGRHAAEQLNLDLKQGVYAGLLGPSYETPAEIRMLRALGADAVGMSTVLEVLALRQLGVKVGAVSAITNQAAGLSERALDHADVQAVAGAMQRAFVEFVSRWAALVGLELSRG